LLDTNRYAYVQGNPITRIDPLGLWYVDVNVSYSWWGLTPTGGILFGCEGIYIYGGGGVSFPPGLGFTATWSPLNPTPGWNRGVTIMTPLNIGGQVGYDFYDWFWEIGVGKPGVSFTRFHVWDISDWFGSKDDCNRDDCP
jgi:hypothetical protein